LRLRRMPASMPQRPRHNSARNWWKRDPDEVIGVMKRRHQKSC